MSFNQTIGRKRNYIDAFGYECGQPPRNKRRYNTPNGRRPIVRARRRVRTTQTNVDQTEYIVNFMCRNVYGDEGNKYVPKSIKMYMKKWICLNKHCVCNCNQ